MRNFILFFITILFFGCSNKETKRTEYVIGFSQCIGSDEWRKTMLEEMKRELSFHPEVKLIYKDANGNNHTQINHVKDMIRKKINLLIISPNEARPLTPIVEEAFNSGIPVIVIDRKTSSSLYTAYVGGNNYEIGRLAAEYIATKANGKANILEIMGLPGSSPAIERQRGFYEGLKPYPNVKVVKQVYGNWLKEVAQQEVTKLAPSKFNIDIVFAHNDQMALGAYLAFKKVAPEKKIKIMGVDALPGAQNGLQQIANGTIQSSMLYPTGGKEAIRTALNILNNEPFNRENILKTLVADSSNVQLMRLQADKMNSQQKDIERQQKMLEEQMEVYNNQQIILNILVISLVFAIVFGSVALYSLRENWKNNKVLEAKNEEILLHQQQLIEMSAKANAASEAKFNFFTNISHEFRTPLTLINIPLEELLEDNKLPETAKKHLNMIHKNSSRLLRLVNQLIDFRKIEYDNQSINPSENDFIAFVKDIANAFKDIAKRRKIDLRVITTERELDVWFDVNMLDKVIFNLLSNAFKFTNDHGRIHIRIEKDAETNRVQIWVEDNGVGMSEEDANHAFDLFYQGENDRAKGSGIGLSLSKEIITLHHGSIQLKSEKWKGTSFYIVLPLGSKHFKIDENLDKTASPYVIDDHNFKLYTIELEQANQVKSNLTPVFNTLKEQSVLIIEDNEDMLGFLKQRLSADYEVFTADNGETGLNEALEKVPDLIISDIVMPGKSGISLLNSLKNDIRTSHIPVILLTAKTSDEHQIEGMQAMADAYISKPFNMTFLMESIISLLNNRVLMRSHYSAELPVDSRINMVGKLDKKFLNEFSGIVESNLANENLSVEEICKMIGISRVQLYRKVKALMGCGVSEYIINKRLKKAKYLLLNEDLSISEITYMVGIASPTYFSTLFKSKYGCTPTEFKKEKTIE
ncbi:MAG: substrate-binding domain-containing protein [Pedobacter sp.]|uniref:substrate-binding domain-containing protein n=1 Tax=Pedobacter sp. TaxID=1411316 RepID=UPI00356269AE